MPTVHIASHAEHVDYERVCSNCEHRWTASFDIGVRSMAQSTGEKAAKEAALLMSVEKEDRYKNRDVLCPQCAHFSVNAMNRHFRKSGLAGGILKKYKAAMWMNLAGFAGFGWLPALVLAFANYNPLNSEKPILSTLWLIIVVGMGGVALFKLIGFVWGLAALSSVRRKVTQLSDEQLVELAVTCYKANKDSLDATGLEEIKWNAWFRKPLFCKPASVVVSEQAIQ